jgi:hypothetical protein
MPDAGVTPGLAELDTTSNQWTLVDLLAPPANGATSLLFAVGGLPATSLVDVLIYSQWGIPNSGSQGVSPLPEITVIQAHQ